MLGYNCTHQQGRVTCAEPPKLNVQLVKVGQSEKGTFKLGVHSFFYIYLQSISDKPKIPGYTIETDTNYHIYEEFPGKLSNTAEADLAGEIILSDYELYKLNKLNSHKLSQ